MPTPPTLALGGRESGLLWLFDWAFALLQIIDLLRTYWKLGIQHEVAADGEYRIDVSLIDALRREAVLARLRARLVFGDLEGAEPFKDLVVARKFDMHEEIIEIISCIVFEVDQLARPRGSLGANSLSGEQVLDHP